jgi:5-methylcytosine-specific restriction protein A
MRKLRQKAYQSTEWRKTRETYMHSNPLCEECLKKGKVTPATSVHHIKSPFKNGEINQFLLLDYENLMSVCHECHADIHNRQEGKVVVQDVLRKLADLLDNKEINNE